VGRGEYYGDGGIRIVHSFKQWGLTGEQVHPAKGGTGENLERPQPLKLMETKKREKKGKNQKRDILVVLYNGKGTDFPAKATRRTGKKAGVIKSRKRLQNMEMEGRKRPWEKK